MAKNPDTPKKSVKTPKSRVPKSKAHRPEVQPIGPALAELLNPAINRGESGMGSGTGLQPPPANPWNRRSSGEAAAHRARASTPKNFQGDTGPRSTPLRSNPQSSGARGTSSPPPRGEGEPGGLDEAPQANYGTAATIPVLDPELARQLGFTTEEEDAAALARPPRNKLEGRGVRAHAA